MAQALRGNTRDPEYRRLVQLYEFAKLKKWTRRLITPTDIDGRYYIHSEPSDYFLFLELKTQGGGPIPNGQQRAIDGMCRLGKAHVCWLIAEHPVLSAVEVPGDIIRFKIRMFDEAAHAIVETHWIQQEGDTELCVGWWVHQWFKHAEDAGANHFVTTFRQFANVYPVRNSEAWMEEMHCFQPDRE